MSNFLGVLLGLVLAGVTLAPVAVADTLCVVSASAVYHPAPSRAQEKLEAGIVKILSGLAPVDREKTLAILYQNDDPAQALCALVRLCGVGEVESALRGGKPRVIDKRGKSIFLSEGGVVAWVAMHQKIVYGLISAPQVEKRILRIRVA